MSLERHEPILFFDGSCALCSSTVQWALRRDKRGILRFAPLEGETHRRFGNPGADQGGSTLILVKDGEVFMRSAGAIRLLWALGGVWGVLGGLVWLIPRPLRDLGYRFVAKYRHRWFGFADPSKRPEDPDAGRVLD